MYFVALELRMPVAELMSRLTWAEFSGWLAFFGWRAEQAERVRKGLPPDDGQEADAERIHQTMQKLEARMKGLR